MGRWMLLSHNRRVRSRFPVLSFGPALGPRQEQSRVFCDSKMPNVPSYVRDARWHFQPLILGTRSIIWRLNFRVRSN